MRSESTLDLQALLAPLSVDNFLARYWERKPLVLRGRAPAIYRELPSVSEFEQLAASLVPANGGALSIVKTHAHPPTRAMLGPDNVINLSELLASYRDGHSLLLSQVQRQHRATGRLCRAIEAALVQHGCSLSKHVGAYAYLSPPHAQGFPIHYDPHDVFVLQLAGRKSWRLYGSPTRFPTQPPNGVIPADMAGRPKLELVVEPGDLLYIPRGVLHDANTGDTASLHLSLGIQLTTWRDLLADMLAGEPSLGRSLPRGFGRQASPTVAERAQLRTMTSALAHKRAIAPALQRISSKLLGQLVPLPTGSIARADDAQSLDADSWLALVDSGLARVTIGKQSVTLAIPGTSFEGDRTLASTFRLFARGQPVRPRDLPVVSSAAAKLALVRELYASGLLAPARPPDPRARGKRKPAATRRRVP